VTEQKRIDLEQRKIDLELKKLELEQKKLEMNIPIEHNQQPISQSDKKETHKSKQLIKFESFINEHCDIGKNLFEYSTKLFEAYIELADDNEIRKSDFDNMLSAKGYMSARRKFRCQEFCIRNGIRLKTSKGIKYLNRSEMQDKYLVLTKNFIETYCEARDDYFIMPDVIYYKYKETSKNKTLMSKTEFGEMLNKLGYKSKNKTIDGVSTHVRCGLKMLKSD
jgi:hypothetical protein